MKKENFVANEESYSSWTDDQLVKAVTVDRTEYYPEALVVMQKVLEKRGIPTETFSAIQTSAEKKRDDDIKRLTGIGGFLLLFLLNLVVSVFLNIMMGIKSLTHYSETPIFTLAVFIPSVLFGLFGAYVFLLVREEKKAPRWATGWIIANCLLTILGLIFASVITGNWDFNAAYLPMGALLWIMYFSSSKRVKATYGE